MTDRLLDIVLNGTPALECLELARCWGMHHIRLCSNKLTELVIDGYTDPRFQFSSSPLNDGFHGMKIATYANARTTLEARKGVGKAFITAFRSGAVMDFLLAASGLIVLYFSINLFKLYYGDDWEGLYESITGYGLGGSSMALFGRVSGGIYTKAADVGADLVGKVEKNIPEDDPRNPAVIADNVGDNVGDIAGMGSDLFGSYAESSCAALFVASYHHSALAVTSLPCRTP
ncbi:hypothetical protein MLD38_027743 [Melastoma candidum]|uniref:Uncharacterized protein n=1 Tax=Melastoma candidum TaxID=119954 RepID=A0ACB9P2J8_9MYRT|nr:hypothetical protein MLD38_027743 [Melastoma candidum]